jgi:L-aspartate oxidase
VSVETDFIVIGSGIAGLRAAVELADAGRVLILTKDRLTESSTEYAQGGVAVVLSDDDEIQWHYEDTLRAGAGLCDAPAVRLLVEEGPRYVQELMAWGCRFDRQGEQLERGREAAHSRRRIIHAQGDSTGREIVRTLLQRIMGHPQVEIVDHARALELLGDDGRCEGVRYVDTSRGRESIVVASAVILATGGAGQIYAATTNPDVATGDGMAMAYEAGAVLCDMEFVQFHPTALALPGAPRFLLTEALRGEGGVVRDCRGVRFLQRVHEKAELAPRDIVARAIFERMRETGSDCVYLDLTHLDGEFLRRRFPRIWATCQAYGLDITREAIPVSPAAHYFMGGVRTDTEGRTGIEGLYAAGEVACTGVHGANRLASNSLLEGLVFGARAARAARCRAHSSGSRRGSFSRNVSSGWALDPEIARQVRQIMWSQVGIVRHRDGLQHALATLDHVEDPEMTVPTRNFLTVARLVARAALFRQESRGAHYRRDFPDTDDRNWRCHSAQQRGREIFTLAVEGA